MFCDNEEISSRFVLRSFGTSLSGEPLCTDSACTQVSAASVGRVAKIGGVYRGAVLEGRDIGTVVLPQADYKFFVEASPARARRRFAELQAKDPGVCFEDLGGSKATR